MFLLFLFLNYFIVILQFDDTFLLSVLFLFQDLMIN